MLNRKFLSEFRKFFNKIHGFNWFFYSDFHKFDRVGGFAPEPATNAYLHIFLNYWHNFREKFDRILQKFWKNCKISNRTIQKCLLSIYFSTQSWLVQPRKMIRSTWVEPIESKFSLHKFLPYKYWIGGLLFVEYLFVISIFTFWKFC